jgi:hypothetical protein
MKIFIKKIVLFILPILFIGLAMEVLLRRIPNDYKLKRYLLEKNASDLEVLIMGNSHSFYGVNPEYLSASAFNASHISQTLEYDYAILKKFASTMPNLHTVIIPISYFSLYHRMNEGRDIWRAKNYSLYYGIHLDKSITNNFEIFANRLNSNARRMASYYLKKRSALTCIQSGWGVEFILEKNRPLQETGVKAASRHTHKPINSYHNQALYHYNLDVLNKLLQWGLEHNKNILFVMLPTHKYYRQNLHPEQLEITLQTILDLTSVNAHSQFVNLMEAEGFIDEDYYDADHLSASGAHKATLMIDSILLQKPF